ncbi:MAG: hypothetical protein R3F60_30750 [bacterium]
MKPLEVVPIEPPPADQRVARGARFPAEGERKTRYSLPTRLESSSPVGYRRRLSMTRAEAAEALPLLSMSRPTAFAAAQPVTEQALFEEASLGVLSARQSTNFRGFRQVTFGPERSAELHALLGRLQGREAIPLAGAAYTHLVLGRPYRNPFTMLLTLVGHRPGLSPLTVTRRLWQKRARFIDDIPTIGYLPHLHVGILADAMERAAVVASLGQRRALGFMALFCGSRPRRTGPPFGPSRSSAASARPSGQPAGPWPSPSRWARPPPRSASPSPRPPPASSAPTCWPSAASASSPA